MTDYRTIMQRVRRWVRRRISQTRTAVPAFVETFEKNGPARVPRLRPIWRPLAAWLLVVLLAATGLIVQLVGLRAYYQVYQPVPGGRFSEGIAGAFTTANPLYAISDVDTAVSRLLFAGLLRYDDHNQLVGDLAESWSADPTGRVYTVRLRPHLTWQDGSPLTSDDVTYTYRTIQNPDAASPLLPSWKDVKVAAIDGRVVTFTLPNPLSSFPSSLTNGIVPAHLLEQVSPSELRSTSFNTADPIGAGPFSWGTIGVSGIGDQLQEQISLVPFAHYWAGAPKLANFTVHTYATQAQVLQAYESQQLTAIAGLDALPPELLHRHDTHVYRLPLTAGVYVFFKTTAGVLQDAAVRQALVLAADRTALLHVVGGNAQPVDEPLLAGQLGYDPAYRQVTGNAAAAQSQLDGAGWRLNAQGVREKNGQQLAFTLSINDNPQYQKVAEALQAAWRGIGVSVQIVAQPTADFQGVLSTHTYDAVLYGISIGPDPDVYVYWDSAENDPRAAERLNFSEYSSRAADASLEAGRTRLDPALRAVKYRPFLAAWQKDAPALALYQPQTLYISHVPIYGLSSAAPINVTADRFRSVQNWMIDLGWVTR